MYGKKLFCFGYGYTARALSRRLQQHGWAVAGTTRSADRAENITASEAEAVIWQSETISPDQLGEARAILVSTPPGESGCPTLSAAGEALAERADQIKWVGYLSTNGVYGDHGGAWVDEQSELRPVSTRALRRVAAERAWRGFAEEHSLPLIIFRLPGIYGPGRSVLDTVRSGKARRIFKAGQVFSRMHVDDIASALQASMARTGKHDLYNLADDEPAPPQDVIEYACQLLGTPAPPLVRLEDAEMSEMAKGFYADNKRVSNQRMKNALAVTLKYATYRDGLKAILSAENSRNQ